MNSSPAATRRAARPVLRPTSPRFGDGFAREHLRRNARDRDRGLAAEGLKCRAIDHLRAALFLELHPHPQHVAAIGAADRADRVGVFHLAEVARILDRFLDARFQVVVHLASGSR